MWPHEMVSLVIEHLPKNNSDTIILHTRRPNGRGNSQDGERWREPDNNEDDFVKDSFSLIGTCNEHPVPRRFIFNCLLETLPIISDFLPRTCGSFPLLLFVYLAYLSDHRLEVSLTHSPSPSPTLRRHTSARQSRPQALRDRFSISVDTVGNERE